MSRLFITPREVNFISDLTKEYMKDIVGQKIYYYAISEKKSVVHKIYNEAPEKIFENPLEIDALVEFHSANIKTNVFGVEESYDIKAWLHIRDLLDKQIHISIGDFFSYGDIFYEVVKFVVDKNVYGEIEHKVGYEILGKQSRKSQFVTKLIGPTDEKYSDPDAVQTTFVQQRGSAQNRLGQTGDVRELQKQNVVEQPLTGPKEVSPRGTTTNAGSAFYGDE